MLRNAFDKLASGAWKGANLSEAVGRTAQKQYMKSPLMKARCGNTSIRIVWQIHTGYQEEAKVYKQAIRSSNVPSLGCSYMLIVFGIISLACLRFERGDSFFSCIFILI